MLADMVQDRLGGKMEIVKGNPWYLIHSPLMEFEELQQAEKGRGGPVRPYGFVRLAYLDDIDGSPQFCRAYLPPGFWNPSDGSLGEWDYGVVDGRVTNAGQGLPPQRMQCCIRIF